MVIDGLAVTETEAGALADTVPPPGAVPVTVPVSAIEPCVRSEDWTVYVAVQEPLAPAARVIEPLVSGVDPTTQLPIALRFAFDEGAVCASVTSTLVSVTGPVLVKANVYVTCWPADETEVGLGVFVSEIDAGVLVKVHTICAPVAELAAGKAGRSALVPEPEAKVVVPLRQR